MVAICARLNNTLILFLSEYKSKIMMLVYTTGYTGMSGMSDIVVWPERTLAFAL